MSNALEKFVLWQEQHTKAEQALDAARRAYYRLDNDEENIPAALDYQGAKAIAAYCADQMREAAYQIVLRQQGAL